MIIAVVVVFCLSLGGMTFTSFAHEQSGSGEQNCECDCNCCKLIRQLMNKHQNNGANDNTTSNTPGSEVDDDDAPVASIQPSAPSASIQPTDQNGPVASAQPGTTITPTTTPADDEISATSEPKTGSSPSSTVGEHFTAINKVDHYGQFDYYLESASSTGNSMKMNATKNGSSPQWKTAAFVSNKAYRYGTYEFTYRLSANDIYLWPMIWTLPDDESGTNTVLRPEFDLLESWGSYTGNSHVISTHVYTGNKQPKMFQKQVKVDLTKEHTIKMDWQPNKVEYYLDGTKQLTVTEGLKDYYEVFIISLGVGTYDGKAPNGEGWFEVTDFKMNPTETREKHLKYW